MTLYTCTSGLRVRLETLAPVTLDDAIRSLREVIEQLEAEKRAD